MGYEDSSILSSNFPIFDERRWVMHIRSSLAEEDHDKEAPIPVSVFSVPNTLRSCRPEAFAPQLFAIGPYHHWHPKLYEMERYKLATAQRTQKQLHGVKLHQLVDHFVEHEHLIRAHYHRYLDYTGETLSWMMVLDASFLLEFLRNYTDVEGKVFKKIPSMSHMVDSARMKLAYNLILRDTVMLENQIPLFVLKNILTFQSSSPEVAEDQLSRMLIGFVKEVSPFKLCSDNLSPVANVEQYAHLLQLLYCLLVPKIKFEPCEIEDEQSIDIPDESKEDESPTDSSYCKQLFNTLSSMNITPVKRLLTSGPIKLLVKMPWKIISSLPFLNVLKGPIESLFLGSEKEKEKEKDDDTSRGAINKPPLVEEIMIPSVCELIRSGVRFSATSGDLFSIEFDVKKAIFYLPSVTLDTNTDVLLRNLVAYETSVESGPAVFTRYTELINGIIDTEEDVKLLRESGIILNRLKSDKEAADFWNAMSKSVRLTKVGFIDKVLVDVNKYYSSRWSVKTRKFMKFYVLGSWQFLTFLAALLLLLLTSIQAFCSVYRCSARWSSFAASE